MIMAIEARHYEDARRALMTDPIVRAMADDLRGTSSIDELTHDNGDPTFAFMQAANREYTKRGGGDRGHIGAVAEALIRIIKEEKEGKTMKAKETTTEEFARLTSLPPREQARPAIARRIRALANLPENTGVAKSTKKAKTKTSRYDAGYAKAYRAARRREAEEFPILITLDF
jgi:hypothetical protein